jgi:hypothetical protein
LAPTRALRGGHAISREEEKLRVTLRVLVGAVIGLLLVGGAGATAAKLVTGKQVKDGSITGKDVKNKSLTPRDFKGSVAGP